MKSAALRSAIYDTTVVHHRRAPEHHFTYQVPYVYLDLAEIDRLQQRLVLFGSKHRPVTLRAADHFSGSQPLEDAVRSELAAAGHPDARCRDLSFGVLTQPRVLGYVFNPVSFWWVTRGDGTTAAVCAEINNTFGERLTQVLTGSDGPATHAQRLSDEKPKAFHVSPFLGLDLTYRYHYPATPGDQIRVGIQACDHDGPVLTAHLRGQRRPLNDRGLLHMIAALPPQRTMWRIHAQAYHLWRRHAPFRHKPPFVPGVGSLPDQPEQEAA